ncbi:hypothetical protein E8E13_007747 [Curvularia kusanoi]|uniref:Heterokaryon incompatibility domain-containing protein n=1 Tax=Curvularia kusanoi TaxID=90978 RepID=A0A9P4TGK1_CURKU|nr:hypothetical protein E8E13_007747 [Curvularia kusanoi]
MFLASFWLRSCMREHEICTDFQIEGILPNRIIDISDPMKPLLREGGNRKEQYVTLSYMWGTGRKYFTLRENLDQHTDDGIPLKNLPKTFEEAIFVARFLGFRWIWIDALCICQDSPDEVVSEIGRMDQIFRTSTLTIFAAAGQSADAGLEAMRDPRWVKPCKLKIKTTLEDNTAEGAAYFTLHEKPTKKPLYERGWVLQEQLMATRGLMFENRQIRWRCLCGYLSESHPSGEEPPGSHDPEGLTIFRPIHERWMNDGFVNKFRRCIQRDDSKLHPDPTRRMDLFDLWFSMAAKYNMRALTYVTDALPAIAGLARAMAAVHGCTYLAGLWKEDIQRGLCWYVQEAKKPYVQKRDATSLPSWSWVSQRGLEVESFHRAVKPYSSTLKFVEHEGITIEENVVMPKSTEEVVGPALDVPRSLTVFGRLRKIDLGLHIPYNYLSPAFGNGLYAQWERPLEDMRTGEKLGSIAFDSDPSDFAPSHVYCLLCTVEKGYRYWSLTGLALVPTGESMEVFKRIGLARISKQDFFGDLDKSESEGPNQGREEQPLRRKLQII